jgi:peptide/nickel transport system substrate-binding protein
MRLAYPGERDVFMAGTSWSPDDLGICSLLISEVPVSVMKSVASRRVLACLAVSGLFLTAACSAATQTTNASAAGPPQSGGTLVVAQSVDATPGQFLSPSLGNILTEYAVFETLTRISTTTGEPYGVIAQSWKLSPDGKSMSIQLRHGVTFHSGQTLTSADVLYTLRQAQNPGVSPQGAPLASQISGMTANGDYEVNLTFKRPMPNIFDLFEITPIVNPATFGQISAGKVVDGTGPYVWKSWVPGSEIVLQKYGNYRDAKDIHLDTIDIDVITDPTAELDAIKSGRVQYAVGLASLDASTLAKQPGYALLQTGGAELATCFDTATAPFDNQAVRQAVQYAIDRQRIVAQVEGGLADATDLPWHTSTPGYDTSQSSQYTYQPGKAKQLLASAGIKSGTSFNLVTLDTPELAGIAQVIKYNLAAIGLNANVQALAQTSYNQREANGNMGAPAFLLQTSQGFSPATQVEITPQLRASSNLENFQNAQYTSLVNALTSAVSPSQQQQALTNYDAYSLNQAFCVPEVTRQTPSVRTTTVNGITATAYGFLDLATAYLVK